MRFFDQAGDSFPGTMTDVEFASGELRLTDAATEPVGTWISNVIDIDGLVHTTGKIGAVIYGEAVTGPDFDTILQPYDSTFGVLNDYDGPINPDDWVVGTVLEVRWGSTFAELTSSPWLEFVTQDVTNVRYLQFRITLSTTDTDWTPRVTQLLVAARVSADPPRTEGKVIDVNQASHGFSVGNALRYNGSTWVGAQANSEANVDSVWIVSAVIDTDNFVLTLSGRVEATGHGYTVGETYYVSPSTAGAITVTKPTGGGEFVKRVVHVIDANTFDVHDHGAVAV